MTFRRNRQQPEGESSPPIRLSPTRWIALPTMMFVGALGATVSATVGWMALQSDVRAATAMAGRAHMTSAQNEERLRLLEKSQVQIAEALEWIKRRLEEDRRPWSGVNL